MKNNRLYQYDYMRALGAIFIIGIHSTDVIVNSSDKFSLQWWGGTVIQLIVRIGLPLFFMMSGALTLKSQKNDIVKFYKNRFVKIIIPLVIYSFMYLFVYSYRMNIFTVGNIVDCFKQILAGPVHYHLWFVYTIVGIYLCTPFLKKMLINLSDKELIALSIMLITIRGIFTYLPSIGISIGINSIIFDGWVFYYILGYVLQKNILNKYYKGIFVMGGVAFVISLINIAFLNKFTNGVYDFAPTMIIMTTALFMIFEINKERLTNKIVIYKPIKFISDYSYSVYLIHALVLSEIVNKRLHIGALSGNFIIGSICTITLTLIISLILAYIIDNTIIKLINVIIKKLNM